ncbi:hypothetical protein PYCC9005_004953 [Savitreella phatthalungensis]
MSAQTLSTANTPTREQDSVGAISSWSSLDFAECIRLPGKSRYSTVYLRAEPYNAPADTPSASIILINRRVVQSGPDAVGKLCLEFADLDIGKPTYAYTARDFTSYRVEARTFEKGLQGSLGLEHGVNAAVTGHTDRSLTVENRGCVEYELTRFTIAGTPRFRPKMKLPTAALTPGAHRITIPITIQQMIGRSLWAFRSASFSADDAAVSSRSLKWRLTTKGSANGPMWTVLSGSYTPSSDVTQLVRDSDFWNRL